MIDAKHIKNLRLEHNYTQEYLATCLEISQKSYSNLENGEKSITLDLLKKIADCYNMSCRELLERIAFITPVIEKDLEKFDLKPSQLEYLNGVNKRLQLDYIHSLESRIEDLNRIIELQEQKIKNHHNQLTEN